MSELHVQITASMLIRHVLTHNNKHYHVDIVVVAAVVVSVVVQAHG